MIDRSDFEKKQMIFFFPSRGDQMRFRNDNLLIVDKEGKVKSQVTCYRIFLIYVIGDTSMSTGFLQRAKKFGISICLMNQNLKVYQHLNSRMEGNTILRKLQYQYDDLGLARQIILNKIMNQRRMLYQIRGKTPAHKEALDKLDAYIIKLESGNYTLQELLGIEGNAARCYFPQIFNNVSWDARRPRIKSDYINACLDIGYTIVFQLIDSLLNVYGFDEYYGVLHRCFYMRKSLVCDLMEPFRPLVDYTIRKAVNLGQFKEEDFECRNKKYYLSWKVSAKYTRIFLDALLEYRDEMFCYIQGYYRSFMKQRSAEEFPMFLLS